MIAKKRSGFLIKILHLNEHLDWKGGVETYLLTLLPELERLGHTQAVAYAKGNAKLAREGYELEELDRPDGSAETRGRVKMASILKSCKPDLVHLHQVHNTGAVQAALEYCPTVLTGHDYRYLCPVSNFYYKRTREVCELTCGPHCFTRTLTKHCLTPRPRYAWRFYRRVKWMEKRARLFAQVIAPSAYAGRRFAAGGFPEDRISVVPYFCPVVGADAPRRLPENPTVLYIGRTSGNKGIDVFIKALGLLNADVQGVIVGDVNAETEQALRSQARTAGCEGRLSIRPWASREEIQSLYDAASVFVFPSVWAETLGIVGLEALARGVPVVASDVGGVREWLLDEQTGILVRAKDAGGMAAALGRIIDDPELNRQMGQRGIELIGEKFTLARHVDSLLSIYRRAACAIEQSAPGAAA